MNSFWWTNSCFFFVSPYLPINKDLVFMCMLSVYDLLWHPCRLSKTLCKHHITKLDSYSSWHLRHLKTLLLNSSFKQKTYHWKNTFPQQTFAPFLLDPKKHRCSQCHGAPFMGHRRDIGPCDGQATSSWCESIGALRWGGPVCCWELGDWPLWPRFFVSMHVFSGLGGREGIGIDCFLGLILV